jgi:CubicO group peptidase (beta-lactamase class C family)
MAWRAIKYNKPSITDYRIFEERVVHRGGEVSTFIEAHQELPPTSEWALGKWYEAGMSPEEYFVSTGTEVFLVLHDDSLLYEYYSEGYSAATRINAFSVSKSVISVLTGIALEEGYIDNLDQPIGDFLDYCLDSSLCKITVRHLLQMTSGIRFTNGYLNPWATSSKLYYGDRLEDLLHRLKSAHPPGTKWAYSNVSYQLLGMLLAKATGRPLAQYLEEKIWIPLGMEADAGWSLHEDTDIEKGFCCVNARARDFARFGRLMLNKGIYNGQQIVPREWLKQSFAMDTADGSKQQYQFGWYLSAEQNDFYAEGLMGQFVYVAPSTRTVIVRMGNSLDFNVPWYSMFKYLAGLETKPKFVDIPKKDLKPLIGKYTFGVSNYGDSTLVGKTAKIRVTGKGLNVKSEFGKGWTARPQSDSVFFNLRKGRKLRFRYDEAGEVKGMRWERRGNSWELKRN